MLDKDQLLLMPTTITTTMTIIITTTTLLEKIKKKKMMPTIMNLNLKYNNQYDNHLVNQTGLDT